MKKLSILVIIVLIIGMLAVPVLAAQSATMTVSASKTTVNRGDTITVTVSTSAVSNCTSGGFMFSFDKNVFEYVSGSAVLSGYTAGVSTAAGNVAGYFMNGNATVQGSIFQITLKVKDAAAFGTYSISGTPSLTAADGAVSCSAGSVSITVACKHSYGGWTKVNDTTHKHTCSVCSKEETTNHTWNSGTVTKKASCKEAGVKTYTCTACNATKTEAIAKLTTHTYDHACDAACNVCGATRTITHKYKTSWSKSKTEHWYECTVCKEKKDAAAHIPGAEATEKKAQTCTVCGYIIKPALGHKHSYATTWTTDENGHWYPCSGCEEKGSYKEHDFENACDKDCSICGYTRETSHTFEEKWTTDATNHWHICTGCGLKQDEAAHEPGAEATATTAQTCTICGYEIAPALGAPETEPTTAITDDTTEPQKGGGVIWIALVAVVVLGVGVAVFIVIRKKK